MANNGIVVGPSGAVSMTGLLWLPHAPASAARALGVVLGAWATPAMPMVAQQRWRAMAKRMYVQLGLKVAPFLRLGSQASQGTRRRPPKCTAESTLRPCTRRSSAEWAATHLGQIWGFPFNQPCYEVRNAMAKLDGSCSTHEVARVSQHGSDMAAARHMAAPASRAHLALPRRLG